MFTYKTNHVIPICPHVIPTAVEGSLDKREDTEAFRDPSTALRVTRIVNWVTRIANSATGIANWVTMTVNSTTEITNRGIKKNDKNERSY